MCGDGEGRCATCEQENAYRVEYEFTGIPLLEGVCDELWVFGLKCTVEDDAEPVVLVAVGLSGNCVDTAGLAMAAAIAPIQDIEARKLLLKESNWFPLAWAPLKGIGCYYKIVDQRQHNDCYDWNCDEGVVTVKRYVQPQDALVDVNVEVSGKQGYCCGERLQS